MRKQILKLSIELASTAQRDQFVDKPNDIIKTNLQTLADLCDKVVRELNDPLAIHPAYLDLVTVKKEVDEEFGMHIHRYRLNQIYLLFSIFQISIWLNIYVFQPFLIIVHIREFTSLEGLNSFHRAIEVDE